MANLLPLDYSEDLFVARSDEVKLVLDTIQEVGRGASEIRRTVTFTGERGIGKSWLLYYLRERLRDRVDARLFYFNLEDYNRTADHEYVVADLLKRFRHDVIARHRTAASLSASLADMSRVIIKELREISRNYVLVILADSVYESNWSLLSLLEEYLLGPLAIEPHTVTVITGRGRAYPWRTPELGIHAEIIPLEAFDFAKTREQLRRIKRNRRVDFTLEEQDIQNIFDYSHGNPLVNSHLALSHDVPGTLDATIDEILSIVDENERQEVRDYLEALCVLRAFKEDRIPAMLSVYYGRETYQSWGYKEARIVRELLTKYAFAYWEEEKYGYVISTSPREQVELFLKTQKNPLWCALQCTAYSLYRKWADQYPRAGDLWKNEADYHADVLREAGYAPDDCVGRLGLSGKESEAAAT